MFLNLQYTPFFSRPNNSSQTVEFGMPKKITPKSQAKLKPSFP